MITVEATTCAICDKSLDDQRVFGMCRSCAQQKYDAKTRRIAAQVYERTEGRKAAWEPPDPRSPAIARLVEAGYLKRVKMRCMFEAFGEVGVKWTDAAHAAFFKADGDEGR